MNVKDAAKVLGLNGEITPEDVTRAYRKAAAKYHPDRNPGGEEMMKAVNAAYEALKGYEGTIDHEAGDYGEALNRMINAALDIKLRSAGTAVGDGQHQALRTFAEPQNRRRLYLCQQEKGVVFPARRLQKPEPWLIFFGRNSR